MKKVLFVLLAVIMVASTLVVSTSAAEIPTDGLIGHFKLDGDLKNEVDGSEGTPYGSGTSFGEALYTDVQDPERWWLTTGVDGMAFYGGDADGFGTNVNPGDNDFTVGFWLTVPTTEAGYVPYMWYGPKDQGATGYFAGERWIGVWNVDTANKFGAGTWASSYGPFVGSNDAAGARLQVEPEASLFNTDTEGYLLQWTHITLSCVQVEGATEEDVDTYTITMYYDGVAVGTTEGMPDPYTGDPETYGDYIYFNGVNAWADNPTKGAIDDVVIYNKALTADEVATLYGAYTVPADFASSDDFTALLAGVGAEEGGDTTEAPDDTTAAPDDTTAAPDDTTAAPDDTTAAPDEEGGCGSAMGAAAAIVALTSVLGCAIIKKH